MTSILFEVSEATSAENCIGSICTVKPASLPISVMRLDHHALMVLVLGRGREGDAGRGRAHFSTCCASRHHDGNGTTATGA